MLERKIEARQLLSIISMFLIVQFAGLLLTIAVIQSGQTVQYTSTLNTADDAVFYAVYVVVVSAVILILLKKFGGSVLFRVMEAVLIFITTFFISSIVFGYLLPADTAGILALAIAVAMVYIKSVKNKLRNFTALIISIGAGTIIGLNGFTFAYIFMALIAVYDYVAVFITKHMLTLAKEISDKNLALLIGSSDVEMVPPSHVSAKEAATIRRSIKVKEIKDPTIRKLFLQGNIPVASQAMLGGGDLFVPLMLSIGAYVSIHSLFLTLMLTVGAGTGMIATMFILKRYKMGLPAIPPLFAFMNLFMGIAYLVIDPKMIVLIASSFILFIGIMLILMLTVRRIEANKNG